VFPGLRNAFGSSIHPKYSGEHFTHELLCAGLSSVLPCPVSLQKLSGVHLGHIALDIVPSLELPCAGRKQKFSGEHLRQASGPPDFGHSGHGVLWWCIFPLFLFNSSSSFAKPKLLVLLFLPIRKRTRLLSCLMSSS
jgi:hypothetical protein